MTDTEINVAIAEVCGWKYEYSGESKDLRYWRLPNFSPSEERRREDLPDYANDLNAMNDAERFLNYDQWRIFLGFVMGNRIIPALASLDEFHRAWHSSPKDQAEAFLRTLGKWKP